MNDLMSQFRRSTSAASPNAPASGSESETYVAFGTRDKVLMLRILVDADLEQSPTYNVLLNIISDGKQGTSFILVYTTMAVLVRGKNLQKIVFAIRNHLAEYIQRFDAKRWALPPGENAPLIEHIEFQEKGGEEPKY